MKTGGSYGYSGSLAAGPGGRRNLFHREFRDLDDIQVA
jgi:hypothetical protein